MMVTVGEAGGGFWLRLLSLPFSLSLPPTYLPFLYLLSASRYLVVRLTWA